MCTYVVIEYERGVLCGGLGDRIVGLCSAILLARSLKKHLLIKWDSPSIEGVFDLSIYNFYNVNPSIENAVVLHTIDDRFKFEKQLSEHPVHTEWNQKKYGCVPTKSWHTFCIKILTCLKDIITMKT